MSLPLFHVMAVYPMWMGSIMSGAHMVQTTPAGYRGDGVFEKFWRLVEHWKISVIVTVPTAAAMLLNYPVKSDVSSLRIAVSGSAPFPKKLFQEFEEKLGVSILEGYGMTEATCVVTSNRSSAHAKSGRWGCRCPILACSCWNAMTTARSRSVASPERSVKSASTGRAWSRAAPTRMSPGTKVSMSRTAAGPTFGPAIWVTSMRTAICGITGRKKDIIIRSGHNIDPAQIEEALVHHPEVTFAGAIGEPDVKAGEIPVAYVELAPGGTATEAEILAFGREHVPEKGAKPTRVIILPELPKTAVGKVFKPDLRKRSITYVLTRR